MPRARTWTAEDVRRVVPLSTSWRQVATAVGITPNGGGSYKAIQTIAKDLGLDTSHFVGQAWNKGAGVGRNAASQRLASQRWYQENKQVYLDRNRRRLRDRMEMIWKLKDRPCEDCGIRYPPFVMDFDHRDGESKLFNIGSSVTRMYAEPKLLAEIAKCDLVCSNCHRIRSAIRGGWSTHGAGSDLMLALEN